MNPSLTRRSLIGALAGPFAANALPRPKGLLVDTHIHPFARDQARFPYHRNATYRPPAQPLEDYAAFVKQVGIDHSVIVHPEPYQDDHRYLEYCFANEPRPGLFKGTCLFDPIAADTPRRMEAIVKAHPKRIVTMRIHVNREAGVPPTTSGSIRDRDLTDPRLRKVWRRAGELGLAIQMHFIPLHAPQIAALAAAEPGVIVILDHLARSGQGTPEQYGEVLRMARLPNVFMKYSAVRYSSKQEYPYADAKPLVRRTFDAFGPDRIIWGGLGMNMADFEKQAALLDMMFDYASESDRAKIRGLNAAKLFGFPA